MPEIPPEAVQAVLDHPWGDWPCSAHADHTYDASCAVCRGDVPAILFSVPSMLPGGGGPTEWTESRPDGQRGDLWRCPDCRRLWLIAEGCDSCTWHGYCGSHYVGLILRPVWMPARWWQRLIQFGHWRGWGRR